MVGVLAIACAERSQPAQLEPPDVRPDGIVAYLSAAPAAAPNEYIVRVLTRRGVAVEDPGSFVAAVQLPSSTVTFLADAGTGEVVRAVGTSAGTLRVAGAAPAGVAGGELFAVRLRAARAEDINALRLELSEINDRSGASLQRALIVLPYVTWSARR